MAISANDLANATADFVDGRIAKALGTSLNSTLAASGETPTGSITPNILARAITNCVDSRIAAVIDSSALPDYSQYLIVDSPFTQDFTDNCGGTWTTFGQPQIQDGRLYLEGSSYLVMPNIALGGQPFTIQFTVETLSKTNYTGVFFQFGSTSKLNIHRGSGNTALITGTTDMFGKAFNEYIGWKNTNLVMFPYTYTLSIEYNKNKLTALIVYFNDVPLTVINPTNTQRLTEDFYLGDCNAKFAGYISNFKVYDGVAVHTSPFVDG